MEKDHSPNSWSELPIDLLISVFERLGFADFQRAKSVCSSWYSASRQYLVLQKNQMPWLILFPEDKNKNSSCMLFNLKEKDKLYKTQDLGVEFAKSVCIATYGSWLLMRDPRYNLYIMNIFIRERIDLPSVESQFGMVKVIRGNDDWFFISPDHNGKHSMFRGKDIRSPVFWIDEKTKDYVVLWELGRWYVAYPKKGDNLWNQIPDISHCLRMVYKDHKLYFFSYFRIFKIFNFSGEIPREIVQCGDVFHDGFRFSTKKFVVTITGDVLVIERLIRSRSFRIHKIYNSSGSFEKHEQVDSLGEEAVFWDLGITMLANEVKGINRNSIYFSSIHNKNPKDLFLFNLETQKTEQLLKFDFDSSLRELSSRWILPSFTHT